MKLGDFPISQIRFSHAYRVAAIYLTLQNRAAAQGCEGADIISAEEFGNGENCTSCMFKLINNVHSEPNTQKPTGNPAE